MPEMPSPMSANDLRICATSIGVITPSEIPLSDTPHSASAVCDALGSAATTATIQAKAAACGLLRIPRSGPIFDLFIPLNPPTGARPAEGGPQQVSTHCGLAGAATPADLSSSLTFPGLSG